ncbi:MAG: PAS domain S-box protein [Candidatus Binatia bacterium]
MISVLQYRSTRAWLAAVQEEEARDFTTTLAAAVEALLEPDGTLSPRDRVVSERLIANAIRGRDVVDVALLDARHAVLAHALPEQSLPPTVWPSIAEAFAGDRAIVARDPFTIVTLLRSPGADDLAPSPKVALFVQAGPSSVAGYVARMAWQIGLLAAGVASFGTLVALVILSRKVLRPTHALVAQAERLAAGDLSARSAFSDDADGNELVRLGQALDRMAGRIAGDMRRLQASEEECREVVELAADGIFTADEHGRVSEVNPAACALMGMAREQVLGMQLLDTVHPDESLVLADQVSRLRPGDVVVREWRLRRDADAYRTVEVSAIRLPDGRLQGITRDITSRKHAEHELRWRMRQQRSVTELGQRALARLDLESLMSEAVALVASGLEVPMGQVLEGVPDASELRVRASVGWPSEDVGDTRVGGPGSEAAFALNADATVVVDDLRTEKRFQASARSVAAGAVSSLSAVIRSGQDPFGILTVHATEQRHFTAGDLHFIETAANVLAQAIAHAKTDEALRSSELRYRLAARATRDAMYDWDVAGDRLYWSEGMALLFGHIPGAIGSGISWWQEYLHPDDRDAVVQSVETTFRNQDPVWRAQYRFRCADGSFKPVHDRAYVEYAADGTPLRAIGAMSDVSEKERAEADLRRQAAFVRLAREVAVAANGSIDVAQTISVILRLVCDHMQWPVGHALLLQRIDRFTPAPSVWHLTDQERFGALAASSEARSVDRGVGLIGHVATQAEPTWITIDTATDFPRRDAARTAGLHAAVEFPVLVGTQVVGILEFFSESNAGPEHDVIEVIAGVATQLGRVIERARAAVDLRDYTERLETLSRRLLQAQETERRHVARELHDEIGQALTALKLNLQALGNEPATDGGRAMLDESIAIADQALQQTRDLSLNLRPALLDDLGLIPALRWYLDRQGRRAGFATEFEANEVGDAVPSDVATTCFRIAQEALTNVARHAQATKVSMALSRRGTGLELVVRDSGRGFDRERAAATAERGGSLGILSMGERAALVGGTLTIDSAVGRGTVIRLHLPLPLQSDAAPMA